MVVLGQNSEKEAPNFYFLPMDKIHEFTAYVAAASLHARDLALALSSLDRGVGRRWQGRRKYGCIDGNIWKYELYRVAQIEIFLGHGER